MKYCLILALAACFSPALCVTAFAQSTTVSINVDINGVRIQSAPTVIAKDGSFTEYSRSVNGEPISNEQVQKKVLSDNPAEKTTEAVDRKFDVNGQLLSTERTVTTERKLPDGGTSTTEIIYRADLNGGLAEKERRTTEVHPQDPKTTSTEITIARPNSNGDFEPLEQHKIVTTTNRSSANETTTREDETIYRRDPNGGFVANRRFVTDRHQSGEKIEESIAKYEADGTSGVALRSQETSMALSTKDGKVLTERNIYAVAPEGSPDAGRPTLIEQQSVVRSPELDGSVRETVTVRRAGLEDSGRLGPATQLSETVCTGKCDAPK